MSHRTESATPLAPATVCGGQVWLRRNIERETREAVGPQGDGGDKDATTREVWVADEVTFVDPSITEEYATEHLDELWERHRYDGMTTAEVLASLGERVSEQESALLELGDLIGGEQ